MQARRYRYWATFLVVIMMAAVLVQLACRTGADAPTDQGKPTVVSTFYSLQYLAQRISGNRMEVVNLTPPGVEPHDWEPTPRDITTIQRARVFIYNGAGFEPWVERVVAGLPANGPLVVDTTDGLELRHGEGHDHEEETSGSNGTPQATREPDHDEEELDPHVWLDPDLYGEQARRVAGTLAQADPAGKDVYDANLTSLLEDLEELEEEMEKGLASCKRDTIVVSHSAFSYLMEHLGIKQLSISGLSPEVEPSPARMREIVRQVREIGATHIFFETLVSPAVAQTIAREVGAQTLVLNPLEGLSEQELQAGEDYLTIMRKNLANLRVALGCQ